MAEFQLSAEQQVGPLRIFKGDKWTKAYGSRIPIGAEVEVLRFMPRRRALVQHQGEPILTMTWCLKKERDEA